MLTDTEILVLRRIITAFKLEYNFNRTFRKRDSSNLGVKNPIRNLTKIDAKLFDLLSETEKQNIYETNQHLFKTQ